MFYISITRMEVRGWIQFAPEGGGQRVSLQGDGWYDREFGGDAARGKGGDAVAVANVQWTWLGLQLSNGTEVVYARTERGDAAGGGGAEGGGDRPRLLQEKALLVDSDGATRQAALFLHTQLP